MFIDSKENNEKKERQAFANTPTNISCIIKLKFDYIIICGLCMYVIFRVDSSIRINDTLFKRNGHYYCECFSPIHYNLSRRVKRHDE